MNQINDTETSLSDMDKAISDLINAIDAKKKSLGNKWLRYIEIKFSLMSY